jgi:membrane protease YdiL (CAAX protease family)
LPDELNPDPLNATQSDATPVAGSNQLSGAPSEQAARWGRADRNNLLIFVGIGFILPGPIIIALHFLSKSTGSAFTIQSELPLKAIAAICVALATWIVARREKRPLSDYGIPPREIFGRRFWEGTVWGFALLSAIPLILRASGNFQIDSVALTGSAALRYGLGWALVFFCVGVAEEFAFRGYWLFSFSRRGKRARYFASCCGRIAFLPDDPAHWNALVRAGIPRSVGLGGDFFLRHAR